MWPIRPERLSEVFSVEEIRALLALGDGLGTKVSFVEALPEGRFRSIDPDPSREERRPDPFCSFFRRGKVKDEPAFEGADAACADCEQKLARLLLRPPDGFRGEASQRRCHMGLTDFQVPVVVRGRAIGSLIAGRAVKDDGERERIRKIVASLGNQTRAEAESSRPDAILIRPLDDKVRKRLAAEILEIPVVSAEFIEKLRALAGRLAALAARQFQSAGAGLEEELLREVERWPDEAPAGFGDLSRQASAALDALRERLGLEHLALFARAPKDFDDTAALPSLVAEAGLGLELRTRWLELDWSRAAPAELGERELAARGHDLVLKAAGALRVAAPEGAPLSARLAGSLFFAPAELRPGREAGVFFGPARSDVAPDEDDLRVLARLAKAVAARYYAAALEGERRRLRSRLDERQDKLHQLEETLADVRAAERLAKETKGFTDFDVPKLVRSCASSAAELAASRGVEIDARALPDRLHVRARRELLAEALANMIRAGIERSEATTGGGRPSPLRIFFKRGHETLTVGVEAIGEFLAGAARRALLGDRPERGRGPRRPQAPARGLQAAPAPAASVTAPGDSSPPPGPPEAVPVPANGSGAAARAHLDVVFEAARRHKGRFHIESERLHRFEGQPSRWAGKTSFILELPASLVRRKEESEGAAEQRRQEAPPEAARPAHREKGS
jgi:hypothetical protein